MKKISDSRNFSLIRLVFVIGVLAAMMFSNGEGITLLPFSHSDYDKEISFQKPSEKQIDGYVFSVHGAGNLRSHSVSKYQKTLKNFSLASFFPHFYPQNDLHSGFAFQNLDFDRSDLPILSGVLSEPSDRAPPAV